MINVLFEMFWPTVLSHKIDSDSPLWEVTARDISSKQFEIVLTFEGTTPETGNTVQVRDYQENNYSTLGFWPLHPLVWYQIYKQFLSRCGHPTFLVRYCGATGSNISVSPTTRLWTSTLCPTQPSTPSFPTGLRGNKAAGGICQQAGRYFQMFRKRVGGQETFDKLRK